MCVLSDGEWKIVGCEIDVGVNLFASGQRHRWVGGQQMVSGVDVSDNAGADDHWVDVGVVKSED